MTSTLNSDKNFPSFIYSGEVTNEELKRCDQMIKSLGGKLLSCRNEQFISSCTHILCFSFFSSVKIMGGLASGKWLVEKAFIEESFKTGKWLPEEKFEVKKYNQVAKFLRLKKRKLYDGSMLYVDVANSAHTKSLVRVLAAGGAIMVNRNDIVQNNMKIEYAITDQSHMKVVQALVGESTPILKLDYIKETIFFKHDPRDKRKFILNPESIKNSKFGLMSNEEEENLFLKRFWKPVNDVTMPVTPRIRRRTNAINTSAVKTRNIASYFLKKEEGMSGAVTKKPKIDYTYNSSEIEIIKVVNTSIQEEPDCVLLDSPPILRRNSSSSRADANIEISRSKPTLNASNNSERLLSDMATVENKDRNTPKIFTKDSSVTSHSISKMEPPNNILQELHHKNTVNKPKNNLESKTKPCSNSTFEAANTVLDENIEKGKESEKSIYLKNKSRVLESKNATVVIDFERISEIITSYIIQLNTSHHYLNSNHITVYSYKTVDKKVRELCSDDSLYISSVEEEKLHIITKRVGRYKLNVSERVKSSDQHTNHSSDYLLIALESLQWLQLRIQPDIYPSHATLGLMIKNHILKCPFSDVSNRALSIFLGIVNLHPPHNKRMRNYYLNVFKKASSQSEVSHSQYKGWSFIRIIVNDLLAEGSDKTYDVHTTLEYVIKLLELDMIYYNERPVSSSSLLSYRMLWVGVNQNPSIINEAVKELIKLWIKTAKADRLKREKVTKLLCIMMEMMWKWCDIGNPFLLSEWPLPPSWMPVAHSFISQFKESSNCEDLLLLVDGVNVPWQQMLLSSLAYRALTPSSDILVMSMPGLKSALEKEVKCCKKEDKHSKNACLFPHVTKIQQLTLLIMSYLHTTGAKYCKSVLIRQFQQTLKKNNVLHSHSASSSPQCEHASMDTIRNKTNNGQSGASSKEKGSSNKCDKKRNRHDTTPTSPSEDVYRDPGNDDSVSGRGIEEVEDRVIKHMVSEVINLFKAMQPYKQELEHIKTKCSHIANSYFTNQL